MISARNQIEGTLEKIEHGAVNCEVIVRLHNGDHLAAIISNGAASDLALAEGESVVAVIKAADVMIAKK